MTYGPPPGPPPGPQPGQQPGQHGGGYGQPPQQGGYGPQPGQGQPAPQGQYGPPQQYGQPQGQFGPPGQYGGGAVKPGFDFSKINPLDWAIVGVGVILFVFSFFGYYSFDYPGVSVGGTTYGGGSQSFGAWHTDGGTWLAWLAMAIGVIAAVVVALQLFVPSFKLPWPSRLLALGLFTLSFLLYVIAIFAHDDFGPDGGHGFSFWISLVLALVGAVLSLMRLQQTGERLPGFLAALPAIGGSTGAKSGAAHSGVSYGPPAGYGAPQGYQPPAPQGYQQPPAGYGQQPPPAPGGYQPQQYNPAPPPSAPQPPPGGYQPPAPQPGYQPPQPPPQQQPPAYQPPPQQPPAYQPPPQQPPGGYPPPGGAPGGHAPFQPPPAPPSQEPPAQH